MLVRIVKLRFRESELETFKSIFEHSKQRIRNSDGCLLLEFYQDQNDPRIFFTYSHWESQECLDAYRNSEFFREVWSKTKALFSDAPEAWSVDRLEHLP